MKRFRMWPYWVALLVIFLLANAPIFTMAYGVSVAQEHGCTINENYAAPCIVDGVDRSRELQALGISAFYLLLTWPAGVVLFVIWLVILLLHRRSFRRRQAKAAA